MRRAAPLRAFVFSFVASLRLCPLYFWPSRLSIAVGLTPWSCSPPASSRSAQAPF